MKVRRDLGSLDSQSAGKIRRRREGKRKGDFVTVVTSMAQEDAAAKLRMDLGKQSLSYL